MAMENEPFEDVFPIEMGIFHWYFSLPEGKLFSWICLFDAWKKFQKYSPKWWLNMEIALKNLETNIGGTLFDLRETTMNCGRFSEKNNHDHCNKNLALHNLR